MADIGLSHRLHCHVGWGRGVLGREDRWQKRILPRLSWLTAHSSYLGDAFVGPPCRPILGMESWVFQIFAVGSHVHVKGGRRLRLRPLHPFEPRCLSSSTPRGAAIARQVFFLGIILLLECGKTSQFFVPNIFSGTLNFGTHFFSIET